VILRIAVSVEHRLVTDRRTDRHTSTAYTALAWRHAVKFISGIYESMIREVLIRFRKFRANPEHISDILSHL